MFGPWADTEFFINAGRGFHENDARGTTITVDPADGVTTADRVNPMVRASGAEVGVRTALLPYTQLALTSWKLDLDSELLYVGDAGATEANRASDRHGVELGRVRDPARVAHARCRPRLVARALQRVRSGRQLHSRRRGKRGFGGRRAAASERVVWRRAFPALWQAPLIEDDSVRSDPTTVVNLEVGYRLSKRFAVSLAAYNLFDSHDNDITYFYESQLPGEGAPVEDRHFHPVEPRTLRLTVETRF